MTRILWLAALLSAATAAQGAERRPNVLLVITDDQGYGDLGLHGNPHLKTPNLDRFGRENTRFDRFVVNSFCSPTRASLLTGRYSLRTGVWGVTHNKEAMRPSEVTLAEALRPAGYRTACVGKWHNGEQFPYTPQGQGFDEFFGFHNGHWNNYFDTELLRGTALVPTKGYIADVLTDEAIRFVRHNRERPFLCYLAYNTPHSPYQVPDAYFNPYKTLGLDDRLAAVYGMVANLDANFGRLLAVLDELKLADDTIVLFLTDNGPNGDRYNAGMRGRKSSVHEGGCRVPLFLRWPARFRAARVVPHIAAHIDLYPTLLDLCGVKPPPGPPVDGTSLRPLLEGKDQDWPARRLFTHNANGQWQNRYPGAVRTPRYRLVREAKGGWQLYDMLADPGQKKDLAATRPDVVKELSAAYEAWYDDVTRAGCERFPLPVGRPEEDPVTLHAPQAYFDKGIHFHGERGYANDWLTGWTDPTARIWFDLDVARAGNYEVTLHYVCPEIEAGAQIRVRAGESYVQGTVKGTAIKTISLPHRDAAAKHYTNREWASLPLGTVKLGKGRTELVLEAVSKPGKHVLDLKGVIVRFMPD